MDLTRPGPGDALNPGPPTPPRQAASVILVRGGDVGLEALLLRRNPAARFMGGVWVFPGGAVDAGDEAGPAAAADADGAHRAAAVRELAEEAGVTLPDPAVLVPLSRWITPPEIAVRFDTRFFLAPLPPGAQPRADGQETVAHAWHAPAGALDAYARGDLPLLFPTLKHLELLAGFATAAELLAWAPGREVVAVEPRVRTSGGTARVVLPGEPGYAE